MNIFVESMASHSGVTPLSSPGLYDISSSKSSTISPAVIAGATVGAAALLAILGLFIFLLLRRKGRAQRARGAHVSNDTMPKIIVFPSGGDDGDRSRTPSLDYDRKSEKKYSACMSRSFSI
ncbi:hypothetical protein CVT24_009762 [Panaeolus cyanescens]|uniref:Uncharacterized protein n=1 Tax=Panaeolus cyanescens TaxID=181874 RepID=A0A409WUD2_9AGAR|nr:hypothetical protein CVT24_009762 [Panaeolus cyanescens]